MSGPGTLRYAATAAVLAAGTLLAVPAHSHTDLTVVNWGGAAARAHMLALVRPFEERYGIRVNMEHYGGDLNDVRNQVEAANVKWDVVDFEYSDLITLCEEGYLESIDHGTLPPADDGTPASEDFIDGSLRDCAVGSIIWATVYAYSKTAFPEDPPSTIGDFFDSERYPGKRGLRRDPRGALEWALMADGVAPDDVYPTLSQSDGIERAFEVLDGIKTDLVWWSSGPQPARLLQEGEVVMSAAWNGRLYRPMTEWNHPIDIVWDGQLWEIELWGIVKGTRHPRHRAEVRTLRHRYAAPRRLHPLHFLRTGEEVVQCPRLGRSTASLAHLAREHEERASLRLALVGGAPRGDEAPLRAMAGPERGSHREGAILRLQASSRHALSELHSTLRRRLANQRPVPVSPG